MSQNSLNEKIMLCDLSDTNALEQWKVVTDNVMGGLSTGAISYAPDNTALFSGAVSLENNGGFASMRYEAQLASLDGFSGFKLSVRGDGKTYQFRAHTKSAEKGHAFKCDFATIAGEWLEIDLPFDNFILSAHGQLKPEAGKLNPTEIHQLSFLVAGGQSGEFTLKIRHVEAYR